MSASHDAICPPYIGEKRFVLSLLTDGTIRAFAQMRIGVDYSACFPEGTMLPLEMIVQGPSQQSYVRRVYSRARPTALLVTPKEGGSHLVTLREFAHNKYWGSLVVNVDGPLLEPPRPI